MKGVDGSSLKAPCTVSRKTNLMINRMVVAQNFTGPPAGAEQHVTILWRFNIEHCEGVIGGGFFQQIMQAHLWFTA